MDELFCLHQMHTLTVKQKYKTRVMTKANQFYLLIIIIIKTILMLLENIGHFPTNSWFSSFLHTDEIVLDIRTF